MLGCLLWVKGTVKSLDDPRVIFSFDMGGGIGVLHIAAVGGHLEVCKYLVEELGGDVNAPAPGVGGLSLTLPSFFWKLAPVMSMFRTMRCLNCGVVLFDCRLCRCDTLYVICSVWRCFYCEVFA